MNGPLQRIFNASAVFLALTPAIGSADIITFTDRAAWEAAVDAITLVDFNAETSDHFIDPDSPFFGSAFDAGPFTITEIGSQGTGTKIDAPPVFTDLDIDGTSLLLSSLQALTSRVTVLTYDAPIVAWAADVRSRFGGEEVNYDFVGAGLFSDPVGLTTSFFGMLSTDQSFSVISMNSNFASSFGFDNIASATSLVRVPEPSTLSLFGAALLGFGLVRRRRRVV